MTPAFLTVLIITGAISAFLLFQLLYNLHRHRKTERLLLAFEQVASESGLSISKQQLLGDRIIGFDEVNNKLLFLQLTGKKHTEHLVDLVEVESVRVNTTYSPFLNGHEKMGVLVQTIALQFSHKYRAKPLLLTFYNRSVDSVSELKDRAKLAKDWQRLFSARFKKYSPAPSQKTTKVATLLQ